MEKLKGKVAPVIGLVHGIGAAIAERFAADEHIEALSYFVQKRRPAFEAMMQDVRRSGLGKSE